VSTPSAPPSALVRPSLVDETAYGRLAAAVRGSLGIDLEQYRSAQMWRRISGFATTHGVADPDALMTACRQDASLLAALRDMITINVSEFFRDEPAWLGLAERLRPRLAGGRTVRAWSAGCSIGMEPYSLAILAMEVEPSAHLRIVATDFDGTALAVARAGHYRAAQASGLSPARRTRFMTPVGSGWSVNPEVRAAITFREHNLLTEPVGQEFELIACRNVVIYFTDTARNAVHARLADALKPGGLLFVGATEAILRPERYGLRSDGHGFYVRGD
jgi:chemotaxis protein methyltransferase CheR